MSHHNVELSDISDRVPPEQVCGSAKWTFNEQITKLHAHLQGKNLIRSEKKIGATIDHFLWENKSWKLILHAPRFFWFVNIRFNSTLTMRISDTSPSIAEFHRSIFDFCSLQLTRLHEMETHYTGAVRQSSLFSTVYCLFSNGSRSCSPFYMVNVEWMTFQKWYLELGLGCVGKHWTTNLSCHLFDVISESQFFHTKSDEHRNLRICINYQIRDCNKSS